MYVITTYVEYVCYNYVCCHREYARHTLINVAVPLDKEMKEKSSKLWTVRYICTTLFEKRRAMKIIQFLFLIRP